MLQSVSQNSFPESLLGTPEVRVKLDSIFYSFAKENSGFIDKHYSLFGNYNTTEEEQQAASFYSIVYSKVDPFVNENICPAPYTIPPKQIHKERVPNCLHKYYKHISKYNPMDKPAEIELFTKYRKVKSKLKSAINKLPKENKILLNSLFKDFHKNYSVIRNEAAILDMQNKDIFCNLFKEHDAIRDEIVSRNLRFVIKVSKSFWRDRNLETFESIISAGNLGLFTAIDKFDLSRGIRFLSYAAHWIALEIRLELANNSLIKVPIWWQKTVKKLIAAFQESNTDSMSIKDLSTKAKVSEQYVKQLSNGKKVVNSDSLNVNPLNVEMTERQQYLIQDTNYEDELTQRDIRTRLQDFINSLPSKEAGVVRLAFGLYTENRALNLRQIGNIYNLTPERIRQIKEKAVRLLRKNFRKAGYSSLQGIYY